MNKFLVSLFLTLLTLLHSKAQQTDSVLKVVVVIPLYVNDVFNNNNFTLPNASFPKQMLPGLDFYNGVTMAIDSLKKEKNKLEYIIIDSKDANQPFSKLSKAAYWDSVSLIIAMLRDREETKTWAAFAKEKEIPLISATYPNDGGVIDNPYFILLNPTLNTHIKGLYNYLTRNYSTTNIVYLTRKGKIEEDIFNQFKLAAKNKNILTLSYKVVELSDNFTDAELLKTLDSTKNNTVFCGTLLESFSIKLIKALNANKNYKVTAIGLPSWDGIKEFRQPVSVAPNAKAVEIIYSSPYKFNRDSSVTKNIVEKYKNIYYARASDWFLKGYETVYSFSKILLAANGKFLDHLNNTQHHIINKFNIQPVLLNDNQLGYFENLQLYFYKRKDGKIITVTNY